MERLNPDNRCWKCQGKYSQQHRRECKVEVKCTDCNSTAHCQEMCVIFHKVRKLMEEKYPRQRSANSVKRSANSVTSKLRIQEEDDDSIFYRSGNSATLCRSGSSATPTLLTINRASVIHDAAFHCEDSSLFASPLPLPLHQVLLPDEEEDTNLFCVSSITSPLLKQRGLTSVERGTSSEHHNTTNQTPMAHLFLLARLCLLL